MDFLRYSGIRLRLGLVVGILLIMSLVERKKESSGKMFLAAVFLGLLWLVIAGYMRNKQRDKLRNIEYEGDFLDLEKALKSEKRR